MGWKQWTRERLSAADLQAYLQDQAVLKFASAAAADAAIPAGSRKLGMVRWLDDQKRAEYYDTTGATWRYAFGQPVTAGVAFGGGVGNQAGFDPVRLWREPGGAVHLVATLAVVAFGGTSDFLTIPAGFRPIEDSERTIFYDSGRTPQRVTIQTDGKVRVLPTQAFAAGYWVLDVTWWLP